MRDTVGGDWGNERHRGGVMTDTGGGGGAGE